MVLLSVQFECLSHYVKAADSEQVKAGMGCVLRMDKMLLKVAVVMFLQDVDSRNWRPTFPVRAMASTSTGKSALKINWA